MAPMYSVISYRGLFFVIDQDNNYIRDSSGGVVNYIARDAANAEAKRQNLSFEAKESLAIS